MKSENINELAAALAKAQGEMEAAKKDHTNPFFKSTYADLTSVWGACGPPLSKNGLAVSQPLRTTESGNVVLQTVLLHASGQWIMSELPVVPVKNDPQGLGSALTYCRRYALSALVGVTCEDDDGNEASRPPAPKVSKARSEAPTGQPSAKAARQIQPTPPTKRAGPTELQLARLFAIAAAANWTSEQVKDFMYMRYKKASSKDLSPKEYNDLCNAIEGAPNAKGFDTSDGFPFEPGGKPQMAPR